MGFSTSKVRRFGFALLLLAAPAWAQSFGTIEGGLPLPPYPTALGVNTPSSQTYAGVDAASEGIGIVLRSRVMKSIHRILFRTGSVTTGGANDLDLRIETVDGSGLPTGTLWAATTNINFDLVDADDNLWKGGAVALTADADVVPGSIFAVVIRNNAASFGNWNLTGITRENFNSPYGVTDSTGAGSWSKNTTSLPAIIVEWSDGTYGGLEGIHQFGIPANNVITTATSATTGTRRGNLFQVPFPMKASGAWVSAGVAAGADFSLKLYDSDGTTVMATTDALDAEQAQNDLKFFPFTTVATLAANTNYRIVLVAETANNVTTRAYDVGSAAMMGVNPLGTLCYESAFISSAWVETTTRRTMIGVIATAFSSLSSGEGGHIIGGDQK